jgi:hypothetical protein
METDGGFPCTYCATCVFLFRLGNGLKACAELHRLISKNQETLAELIHKDFEVPLQRNLVSHQRKVEENEKQFERNMRRITDEITKSEGRLLKGKWRSACTVACRWLISAGYGYRTQEGFECVSTVSPGYATSSARDGADQGGQCRKEDGG